MDTRHTAHGHTVRDTLPTHSRPATRTPAALRGAPGAVQALPGAQTRPCPGRRRGAGRGWQGRPRSPAAHVTQSVLWLRPAHTPPSQPVQWVQEPLAGRAPQTPGVTSVPHPDGRARVTRPTSPRTRRGARGPFSAASETDSDGPTHLPPSEPLPPRAAPPFLQVSLRLRDRCASHWLSQRSSSVRALGTRGLSGEIRTFVASVVAKQRHRLAPQGTARRAIERPQFPGHGVNVTVKPRAALVAPGPRVTDRY